MTTATRTLKFLAGKKEKHSLSARQRHNRSNLIPITTRFCNSSNMSLTSRWLIEPMIVHASLITRPHMLQKPQDKLRGRKRKSLILPIPVVPICDCHIPSIISDNPFLGKRWTSSVSAAIRRSLPPAFVSGHHIDDKAARILPVESPYDPLRSSILSKGAPQELQEKVLPQPSVLLCGKEMHRLPYAIGAKTTFGTEHMNVHMEAKIPPVGVNRCHHTRNRRMFTASCAYRSQDSLHSGLSHYQEKFAIPKQDRSELARHGKRQMSVHDIEQSALGIGCSFLSAGYPTGWAESALATETDSIPSAAVIAPVLHESVAFCTAGKSLTDGNFGSLSNRRWQTFIKQSLGLLPMIGQNSKKKTSSAHPNILSDRGSLRKLALFFLGMY